MSTPHTPEPWKVTATDGGWTGIADESGTLLFRMAFNSPENAEKAVSAYNATFAAGIRPEGVRGLVEALEKIAAWDKKYPKGRVYGFETEREFDKIMADLHPALAAAGTGGDGA